MLLQLPLLVSTYTLLLSLYITHPQAKKNHYERYEKVFDNNKMWTSTNQRSLVKDTTRNTCSMVRCIQIFFVLVATATTTTTTTTTATATTTITLRQHQYQQQPQQQQHQQEQYQERPRTIHSNPEYYHRRVKGERHRRSQQQQQQQRRRQEEADGTDTEGEMKDTLTLLKVLESVVRSFCILSLLFLVVIIHFFFGLSAVRIYLSKDFSLSSRVCIL